MRQNLADEVVKRYPTMKPNMAHRYVDKYVTAVIAEIATQYMLMNSDEVSGEMSFAADKVNAASGRAKIGGKSIYIYSMMQAYPATSLVLETYTGNSIKHRISKVVFNPKYKRGIMEELCNLTIECRRRFNIDHLCRLNFDQGL